MTLEPLAPAALTRQIPLVSVGGLPIAVMDRAGSAIFMANAALLARESKQAPLVVTSANGQVLSLCAGNPVLRDLFLSADLIHADGMPLVFASKLRGGMPLPERVATTDLFHDVAREAQKSGLRFYLLGASNEVIAKAVANVKNAYPELTIAGFRNGYFGPGDEELVIDEINAAGADILWVGMGAPRELVFSLRCRARLNVGVIKTSGGLFDFLSGKNRRAPYWMQAAGLEWLYRLGLEPGRLFWRYATTNVHTAYLLLAKPITPVGGRHADTA